MSYEEAQEYGLTVEEWLLGESVDTKEFRERYEANRWRELGREMVGDHVSD